MQNLSDSSDTLYLTNCLSSNHSILDVGADVIVVPAIEAGNSLFKMMVYFMSACAAGIVLGGKAPVLLTSRADPPAARLASAALGAISVH